MVWFTEITIDNKGIYCLHIRDYFHTKFQGSPNLEILLPSQK